MFDRIASFILRLRWPLLALLLIATAMAGWVAKDIRFDFSPRSLFLNHDPDVQFLDEHRKRFGDEDAFVLVMLEDDDIFTAENLGKLVELSKRIAEIEHIDQVVSLGTMVEVGGMPGAIEMHDLLAELPATPQEAAALKERTTSNRLYVHRLVNPEGTVTAVMAKFEDGFVDEVARRPVLAEIERSVDEVVGETMDSYVLGHPIVNREYATKLASDMGRTLVLVTLLVMVLLYALFRNLYSVFLPGTSVGIAVVFTVAYMVLTDDYFNIVNNIVPTLLLVIGVADAVHFIITYYQELAAGKEQQAAVRGTVARVGAACFATSVTAAVGFASLAVARIEIIRSMGEVAALGLMLSYAVILLLVPIVLSVARPPRSEVQAQPHEGFYGRLLTRIADLTLRRRKLILVTTALLAGVCVAGAFRVKSDNFLLEELWHSNPVSVGMHHAEDVLTGMMPLEISIETSEPGGILYPEVLRGMEKLQRHLEADPWAGHSVSVVDLIRELTRVMEGEGHIPDSRKAVAQYLAFYEMGDEDGTFLNTMVDPERRFARISTSVHDWGTNNVLAWYDGRGKCDPRAMCGKPMVELIKEAFPDDLPVKVEARVTGTTLVAANALSRLVVDMFSSLGTAFFVISLLMMLMLRSFRLGLISMIPNVAPLLVTVGFMGWFDIPIRTSTALIFSISVGVAANDTIHFAVRYKEELLRTRDREAALRATMLSTGRAIIFTSLLLVFGFITMLTTRFVGIFQMGLLGAVTLTAALAAVLFVFPITLDVFKPWSRLVEKRSDDG